MAPGAPRRRRLGRAAAAWRLPVLLVVVAVLLGACGSQGAQQGELVVKLGEITAARTWLQRVGPDLDPHPFPDGPAAVRTVGALFTRAVDRWRHPYRVRQALAWAQPGGRLPGAFARAKLAYAVAAASCDDLATLWQCEGYEDGFHNALRWLESLDGINREPHTLLPFVVALYSGAYLTSVQVASPAAAPEPAVAAARWMAPPEAPEPTWVNLPVPLLVPPPPGTLGVFYVDVPHSMWVRSMLSTIKPAVAAMADGRAVFFPASHVGMMRTSAGDVFLAKAVVVERSGQLGPVVHVRIRCSAEPAADRASVRPPPRCEVTRVLQAQFTLSSPIRYFN